VYHGRVQSIHVDFLATESCPCHLTEYDDGDIVKFAIGHRDGTVPVEYPMDLER
jgi:hypothetical protein